MPRHSGTRMTPERTAHRRGHADLTEDARRRRDCDAWAYPHYLSCEDAADMGRRPFSRALRSATTDL
jgi:hypothetical protein